MNGCAGLTLKAVTRSMQALSPEPLSTMPLHRCSLSALFREFSELSGWPLGAR